MTIDDREEIAKLYSTEPKYLGSWILALVEIRNICAHYPNYPVYNNEQLVENYIFPRDFFFLIAQKPH